MNISNASHRSSCEASISRRWFLAALMLAALTIVLTRGISLTYNMDIHPDENKFFDAASSLLDSWLYGTEYVEEKPYPEGAYLFHLPFQALRKAASALTGEAYSPRLWGRIASVFYFTLAVVMGMDLVRRFLGKSKAAVVLYGLSMCFSPFFLEQSRYGVGDMISLFLLMLILRLMARWCKVSRRGTLLWVCFWCGVLGAVKYPQLYFLILPVGTWYCTTPGTWKEKWKSLAGMLLVCLAGFLLFSPKGIFDWAYFYRVIRREMGAYVTGSTGGGAHNVFALLLLYQLFASDFPLAAIFLAVGCLRVLKNHPLTKVRQYLAQGSKEDFFFRCVVPLTVFVFFFYNLFVSVLAMRTMTPYYGLCALYTAGLAAAFGNKGRLQKLICICLTALLIGRGCVLVCLLSEDVYHSRFAAVCQETIDSQEGQGRVMTFRYNYIPHKEIFQDTEVLKLDILEFEEFNNGSLALQPGDVMVVGALDFSAAEPYPLPVSSPDINGRYHTWEAFKAENQEHLVMAATPSWIYYLSGAWIKGDSFTGFTFPTNYLYYYAP